MIAKEFLKPLLQVLQKKEVGIVAPAIEFSKGNKKLFDVGGEVNKLFLRTSHREVGRIVHKNAARVEYVSGCCMVIRKEVFQNIGMFDESFFLYYEDVDFCLRAREKTFETWIVPSVVIHHALSKSVGKMSPLAIYHLLRSGILFGKKYAKNAAQKVCNRIFILTQSVLFLKASPMSALSIVKALLGPKL